MVSARHLLLGALLACSLITAGCTREKALAARAAAESFRDKSVDAIEAVRGLLIAPLVGAQGESERLQTALRQISANAAQGTVTNDVLKGATDPLFARAAANRQTRQLDDMTLTYVEFGSAFARLPDGAAFAVQAVQCSSALGVRLLHRLSAMHESLAADPVPYLRDRSAAAAAIRSVAARKGTQEEIDAASLAYINVLKKERADNEAALRKLAEAAESGQEALKLIAGYGTLDLADMLDGVVRILEIRGKLMGTDADTRAKKMGELRDKLGADDKLKPLLDLPTASAVAECKQ